MSDADRYYVAIKEHIEVRKALLEGSKLMIKSLQQYQNFKQFRKDKNEKLAKLRSLIREIKRSNNKLRNQLPSMPEDSTPTRKVKSPKSAVREEKPKPALPPTKLSELERLENELSDIESKLSRLG